MNGEILIINIVDVYCYEGGKEYRLGVFAK